MLAINFFPSINYYILLYRPWKIHDWSTFSLNTQTEVRLLLRSSWTPTRTLILMPPPLDMSTLTYSVTTLNRSQHSQIRSRANSEVHLLLKHATPLSDQVTLYSKPPTMPPPFLMSLTVFQACFDRDNRACAGLVRFRKRSHSLG